MGVPMTGCASGPLGSHRDPYAVQLETAPLDMGSTTRPMTAPAPAPLPYSYASQQQPSDLLDLEPVFFTTPLEGASSLQDSYAPNRVVMRPRATIAPPIDMAMFGEIGASAQGMPVSHDDVINLAQISFSREGSDFDPTISPDGQRIYYSSTAHSPQGDIFVKNIKGTAITQLTSGPASEMTPALSPDGSRLAYASNRTGSWDIFVMGAEGGQSIQLTSELTHEVHPTWSHDGKFIAFSRLGQVSGRWEIWMTEANNTAVSRFLTYGLFPSWHPSQATILFQRPRERGDRYFSVWKIDLVNNETVAPTIIASSSNTAIINPRWSPDGNYVAVSTILNPESMRPGSRPSHADIWIMKADGSGRANLTGGQFVNLMPCWGPNGDLYFVSNRNGHDNIWSRSTAQAIMAAGGLPLNTDYDPSRPQNNSMLTGAMRGPSFGDTKNNSASSEHSSEIANAPTDITDH